MSNQTDEPTELMMVITNYVPGKNKNSMKVELYQRNYNKEINAKWNLIGTIIPKINNGGGEFLILCALTKIAIENARKRRDWQTPDSREITIEW